ncbi:MAG: outer membrane beta-barrel protein [Muribaculaceae bacterium]|nr:outer membrane beta-barrel protein [Muribaculaceae bacterium]
MKTAILILTALCAGLPAFSRDIKGRILDENNAPLDFVNVVLYCDSTFVAGGISDAEGLFSIPTDADCDLTAKVSFAGYEAISSNVPQSGDMGVISLFPSAVELGEVVVKATRPSTLMKGNALVTNVEGSSLAVAGTANDVLVRVPMVVDNGGSIEVFGKGSPAIYINGRKVNDPQELSQLNSRDIKNVEVITNPGATYAADVKSVIRIRTKPPKGDGFSGTLRTDNGFQYYFRTGNSVDLKYRTGGLEIFANYGWWRGNTRFDRLNDMNTTISKGMYRQYVSTIGKESYNDMTGKLGFSYMINDRHSIGAYYQNSWNRHHTDGAIPSEIWQDGTLLDIYNSDVHNRSTAVPRHYANLYYNGIAGKLNIDFNADYIWYKSRELTLNDEFSEMGEDREVNTSSINRNRMFAEKLVMTYPVWNGQIEVGQEYTDTRTSNLFSANIPETPDADNRVEESNIAGFAELGQRFGRFMIGVGLRYEHVRFTYYEMGQLQDDRSKTYNNIFPSLNIATQVGRVMMGLNYSGKTVRPGYGQLDGAVSYINRLTYETGNPYLKPTKLQTVEYMAQWRRFFAQLSYTYFKDGVYHVTEPYGQDGEATLIRTENLDHRHYLQAFAGGNFQVGAWQPKVNVGIMKQWLTLPVNGERVNMNTPIFMFQWQNAVHLPLDIWLNVDAQLMTRGWDNNTRLTNTPWYINAKLYKGFFNDAFSVTVEAKDLFNSAKSDFYLCSDAVQINQKDYSPGRSVMLTLQYRFNTTRDRYRGTGAGNAEKSRF